MELKITGYLNFFENKKNELMTFHGMVSQCPNPDQCLISGVCFSVMTNAKWIHHEQKLKWSITDSVEILCILEILKWHRFGPFMMWILNLRSNSAVDQWLVYFMIYLMMTGNPLIWQSEYVRKWNLIRLYSPDFSSWGRRISRSETKSFSSPIDCWFCLSSFET